MLKKTFVRNYRDARRGFGYLFVGARHLSGARNLWPLLITPVLINAVLFLVFLWLSATLIGRFLALALPETWWGILIGVVLVVASIGAMLFLGSAVFVFLGSIINAPFYDVLAEKVTRSLGGIVPDHPWWKGAAQAIRHSAQHLWWYLLVQAGLILLYLMPVAVGPIAFVTLGFASTAIFLSLDFLDYSFGFRGWDFAKRRKWCMDRKGLVVGFGTAVFLGLAIPVINLVIPPIAIVASIKMFNEEA